MPFCLSASVIVPVSVSSPDPYVDFGGDDVRAMIHTIDSSGLNINGEHTSNLRQSGFSGTFWLAPTVAATITWDLGTTYSLTSMHIWNYNEAFRTHESMKDVNVYVSTDDSTYTLVGQYVFAQAPGTDTYKGEDYDITATARYVRFIGVDTYGTQNGPYAGLSEVRFAGTATPEPSTIALVGLALLLGIGGARRRFASYE